MSNLKMLYPLPIKEAIHMNLIQCILHNHNTRYQHSNVTNVAGTQQKKQEEVKKLIGEQ